MTSGYIDSHRVGVSGRVSLCHAVPVREAIPMPTLLLILPSVFFPRKSLYGLTFYQISGEQPKMILFLSSKLVAIGLVKGSNLGNPNSPPNLSQLTIPPC
jgi:hypothetical protein